MRGLLCERATVLGAVLLAVMMLIGSDTALGQDKKKFSWSVKPEKTKFTLRQPLDHPDIPGHNIGLFELRRTWPDGGGPVIEGQRVVEEIARGFWDIVTGNGDNWGYTVWRYENGDQTFSQWRNTIQSVINPDRSRKSTYVGTYVMTGGTGKLKGIKGVGRYSGLGEFDPENKPVRNELSGEGEYWFEK